MSICTAIFVISTIPICFRVCFSFSHTGFKEKGRDVRFEVRFEGKKGRGVSLEVSSEGKKGRGVSLEVSLEGKKRA